MLWLLPYVGWTLAASAVASVAGYAAVTQFSVVQRVLAMALDRALRKLATSEDGKPTYTLEHTGTGTSKCSTLPFTRKECYNPSMFKLTSLLDFRHFQGGTMSLKFPNSSILNNTNAIWGFAARCDCYWRRCCSSGTFGRSGRGNQTSFGLYRSIRSPFSISIEPCYYQDTGSSGLPATVTTS